MPGLALAAELVPAAVEGIANLFHKHHKSPLEKKMGSLADIYKEESEQPLGENRVFKEGKSMLDRKDRKRRERTENASAATGATDEARLASMENNNEAYGQALSRLFTNAQQYRQNAQDRYINALGAKHQAHQASEARFQHKLNNIVQPLSQASKAFAMTRLFADTPQDKHLIETGGPAAVNFLQDQGTQPLNTNRAVYDNYKNFA
jgi:hypothetical protein